MRKGGHQAYVEEFGDILYRVGENSHRNTTTGGRGVSKEELERLRSPNDQERKRYRKYTPPQRSLHNAPNESRETDQIVD